MVLLLNNDENPKKQIKKALKTIAVILIIFAVTWIGLRIVLGTETPFFIVASGSMTEALNVGDIIIVRDSGKFNEVNEGEIIVFYSPANTNQVIVHRVKSVVTEKDQIGLVTKGDSNLSADSWIVKEENYIGEVIVSIPKLGKILRIIEPPINYGVAVILLILIFIVELTSSRKQSKEENKELNEYDLNTTLITI